MFIVRKVSFLVTIFPKNLFTRFIIYLFWKKHSCLKSKLYKIEFKGTILISREWLIIITYVILRILTHSHALRLAVIYTMLSSFKSSLSARSLNISCPNNISNSDLILKVQIESALLIHNFLLGKSLNYNQFIFIRRKWIPSTFEKLVFQLFT